MKSIFFLILSIVSLIATGCAHRTIHEECSDPDIVKRYANYDQCYTERTGDREDSRRRSAAAAKAWNDSMNASQQRNVKISY